MQVSFCRLPKDIKPLTVSNFRTWIGTQRSKSPTMSVKMRKCFSYWRWHVCSFCNRCLQPQLFFLLVKKSFPLVTSNRKAQVTPYKTVIGEEKSTSFNSQVVSKYQQFNAFKQVGRTHSRLTTNHPLDFDPSSCCGKLFNTPTSLNIRPSLRMSWAFQGRSLGHNFDSRKKSWTWQIFW